MGHPERRPGPCPGRSRGIPGVIIRASPSRDRTCRSIQGSLRCAWTCGPASGRDDAPAGHSDGGAAGGGIPQLFVRWVEPAAWTHHLGIEFDLRGFGPLDRRRDLSAAPGPAVQPPVGMTTEAGPAIILSHDSRGSKNASRSLQRPAGNRSGGRGCSACPARQSYPFICRTGSARTALFIAERRRNRLHY